MKTYSVKLRIYRGKKAYDKDANDNLIVVSPNQTMDLTPYLSMEWNNWMKQATNLGYSGADVIGVFEIIHTTHTKRDDKEVDPYITSTYDTVVKDSDPIMAEIKANVKKAFTKSVVVTLSPEQQKIANMEAEMLELRAMLKGGVEPTAKTTTKTAAKAASDDVDSELEAARLRYEELYNKKPNHLMKLVSLQKKIEEKENED